MGNRIKILRMISRLNVGGPAQHAVYLSEQLHDEKWETLLVSGQEDSHESSMEYLAHDRGVHLTRLKWMRRSVFLFRDIIALFQTMLLIQKFKPDIMHTHTAKAGGIGRLAAWIMRVPVRFHTFHGHVFHGYFHPVVTSIFLCVERFLARRTHFIITLTPRLASDLKRLGIQGRKGNRVVPLGLDLDRFTQVARTSSAFRNALGIPKEAKVIGIVGRLVPIKRHEDLLHAFQDVLAKSSESPHLVIVGGGERMEYLKKLAAELQILKNVHFLGFRSDLESIYPELDITVLCSANEGMPVSLIEAMVSGIPIVATDVGGVADLLSGCPSCRIVPSFQRDTLAKALSEVLENLPEMTKKASEYREQAYQKFRLENLVHNLSELYLESMRQN